MRRFHHNHGSSAFNYEKVSLESNKNPKNGFVFINGYGVKVRFDYRFDNDPFVSTEPVQPYDWIMGPKTPFAKRNFTVIAVDDVSNEIISATTFSSAEIFAVLLFDNPLAPDFQLDILGFLDPFPDSNILFFLNFNDPVTSPYRYLYTHGQFQADVSGFGNLFEVDFTLNNTATESFTNIYYQLCDSSTNTNNCQSFHSPYLGALEPAETVWVVFSPVRQFQFTSYNPSPVVTPSFINSYYNISSNVGFENASQLVIQSDNHTFYPEDLRKFQDKNGLPHTNLTGDYFGGNGDPHFCTECVGTTNLDVQYITSISQYPTKTYLFYESDFSEYGFAVAWIQYLANLTQPPLVISVSYNQDESSFQPTLIELFNLEAMKVR